MKTIEKTYTDRTTTDRNESYTATIKQILTIADDGKKSLRTDVVIRNDQTGEETHDAEISLKIFKRVCEVYTIDHLLCDAEIRNTPITIIKHDGAWTIAKARRNGKDYEINVKHFEEPSRFGIRNGRISKLWIAEVHGEGKYKSVCNYDRGWDKRATTAEAKALRDELIAMYN